MVYLDTMPLRFGHFRVLITTAMGQFLGAAVATLSGVLIPLLAIVQHHELDSVTQGLIASMELIGIMVGSFVIGKLADKDGYLPFLRLSSILVFDFSQVCERSSQWCELRYSQVQTAH